jgi:hypothetical protein
MKTKILSLAVWSIILLSWGCTNELINDLPADKPEKIVDGFCVFVAAEELEMDTVSQKNKYLINAT